MVNRVGMIAAVLELRINVKGFQQLNIALDLVKVVNVWRSRGVLYRGRRQKGPLNPSPALTAAPHCLNLLIYKSGSVSAKLRSKSLDLFRSDCVRMIYSQKQGELVPSSLSNARDT